MRPGAALAGGAVSVACLGGLLFLWVSAGDGSDEDSGVEINYVDSGVAESPAISAELGESAGLEGLTVAARRPGNMVEMAALATLEGVEIDVAAQQPAIPDLPDIAATPFGLVVVDGTEAVRFDGGERMVTGRADAVVWAGGSLVWHVRNVGDGELEAVLVDMALVGADTALGGALGPPITAPIDDVRPAQGLGLIIGDRVVAETIWDLSGFEILAGSSSGVLVTDGGSYYTARGPEADFVEVHLRGDFGGTVFGALSPGLERVIALDRGRARVVHLATGAAAELVPAVANPLRYSWLPGGDAIVWMEKGVVYLYDVATAEIRELGPATVAISYGSLEVFDAGLWDEGLAPSG